VTAILPAASTGRPPHSAEQLLTITTHPAPPAAIVLTVRGEVDVLTSTQLNDYLLPHVRDTVPHVIVDLTEVSFFTAAGLTVLVTTRQAAVAAGITLRLVASTRPVLLPLRLTGLEDMFDISPDITHALLRAGCGPDG
jgi:anti-anti-sigma factor